ncbi:LOB domain-containing protein 29 [Acorus calamus]|uniref:LOB domain-containing protein 29 n=1 Tax=Acorus calamus TaxID=4465 RepID=A0AAV9C6B3_ACOCL|nr:LOB domain-containing protein 29 [Acorus calamus]
MTGFGSPCGACKFLRRKCVRGCVFAPYFCHEQGAAHFAAIHKVFGASNVSKLLMHLPVADRCEAAVTISYEAQARLQDPIYGCVSHIFALQQQVVTLQAQLASLKAQAAQNGVNNSSSSSSPQEDKFYERFPPYQQQDGHGFFHSEDTKMAQPFGPNASNNGYYNNAFIDNIGHDSSMFVNTNGDESSHSMESFDMEDLGAVAFAYMNHS